DADAAPDERLVSGCHGGRLYLVEVKANRSVGNAADDPGVMPLVVPIFFFPALGCKFFPPRAVCYEYLIGVVVRLLTEVNVVEVRRILIAEEQANVPMRIVLNGASHLGFQ